MWVIAVFKSILSMFALLGFSLEGWIQVQQLTYIFYFYFYLTFLKIFLFSEFSDLYSLVNL